MSALGFRLIFQSSVTAAILVPVLEFLSNPSISGSASRNVGEIFAYDPGTPKTGSVVKTVLVRNNVELGELSGLSGTFDQAGTYKVRTYLSATFYADSNSVTVVAQAVAAITPPTFTFDPARIAGTNPPEVLWDDVDDTVYATDTLEIQWTTAGSTYTKQIAMDMSIRSLHEFLVVEWDNLAAGAFSVRGRYIRTKDIDGNTISQVVSDWGPYLNDTLSAKTLPAPTTVWDASNRSQYAIVDSTQMIASGINSGFHTPVAVTNSRSDARFAEFKVLQKSTSDGDRTFSLGIIPSATQIDPTYFGDPPSMASGSFTFNSFAVGDVFTMTVTPQDGSTAGTIVIKKNGTQVYSGTHNITSYKICFAPGHECQFKLNTGQEGFSYPPAGITRYN